MGMKLVKKTAEYRIYQRRDDRYAVTDAKKRPVNGEEKIAILLAEGLVTAPAAKQVAPEEPEAAAGEAEAADTVAGEGAAEEGDGDA
jgi:hypothetical protein